MRYRFDDTLDRSEARSFRESVRSGKHAGQTSGFAPGSGELEDSQKRLLSIVDHMRFLDRGLGDRGRKTHKPT